jgi:hypothetical protein
MILPKVGCIFNNYEIRNVDDSGLKEFMKN